MTEITQKVLEEMEAEMLKAGIDPDKTYRISGKQVMTISTMVAEKVFTANINLVRKMLNEYGDTLKDYIATDMIPDVLEHEQTSVKKFEAQLNQFRKELLALQNAYDCMLDPTNILEDGPENGSD